MEGIKLLPPGDLVDLKFVGRGGFGAVYRGRSNTLKMDVAWKSSHGGSRAEFLQEARMLHSASFSHIVRVLSIYEKDGEPGLVMEYMPNGSLASLLENVKDIPWALRFRILHEVALGMHYLHHVLEPPIIHRDLKPENVLLGTYFDVKLADFGLARNETSVSTAVHGAPGTKPYIPPEGFNPNYKATTKFDVYSFAILTWSVLSGEKPYHGKPFHSEFIMHGHRPDIEQMHCWRDEKNMVPQAITMMEECWDGDSDRRPNFKMCIERTMPMRDAYAGEVDDACHEVLKKLRKLQEACTPDTPDGNIPSTADFTAMVNRWAPKAAEPSTAVDEKEPDIKDPKKFLRKNFDVIVNGKADLSAFLDEHYSRELIMEESVAFIKAKPSLQDQTRETLTIIMKQGPKSCKQLLAFMWRYHRPLYKQLQQ